MANGPLFAERRLRISYWDSETRFSNADKIRLEQAIKRLAAFDFKEIKTLNDQSLQGSDLLIIAAQTVAAANFSKWLEKLVLQMKGPQTIWVPALVVAEVDFQDATEVLQKYINQNWYFDLVQSAHFDSLPMRIANLIRIHDHLKELHRYDEQLKTLSSQVADLEKKLS